jgi:hypothetical protein
MNAYDWERLCDALGDAISQLRLLGGLEDTINRSIIDQACEARKIVETIVVDDAATAKADAVRREAFSWGKILKQHKIGPYVVFEYRSKLEDKTMFHAFSHRDGRERDTGQSFFSLETAIIGAIAYAKHEEPATRYITRLLGLKWDAE